MGSESFYREDAKKRKGEGKIMKGKIIFLGCLLVMAVAWMLVVKNVQGNSEQNSETSEKKLINRSQADQEVLRAALESPEIFQTLEKTEEVATQLIVQEEKRPKLLSEVERPSRKQVQKESLEAESLYFWKDYESLRRDEIRNPDSKENREVVVALMKARQRRVGQE